jgi:hypothetical protein
MEQEYDLIPRNQLEVLITNFRHDWKAKSLQGIQVGYVSLPCDNELTENNPPPAKLCTICSCTSPGVVRCSRCKAAYYCGHNHQRKDWKEHKRWCQVDRLDDFPVQPTRMCECEHARPCVGLQLRHIQESTERGVNWFAWCDGGWKRWQMCAINFAFSPPEQVETVWIHCIRALIQSASLERRKRVLFDVWVDAAIKYYSRENAILLKSLLRCGLRDLSAMNAQTEATDMTFRCFGAWNADSRQIFQVLLERGATFARTEYDRTCKGWPTWMSKFTQCHDDLKKLVECVVAVELQRAAILFSTLTPILPKSIIEHLLVGYDEFCFFGE